MFGAIAGAIGGIASTILGNNSAKHEAEKNRDWQENMSNTSVQRRMEDLKAAGLNPLLAVSSASAGASTPTGAQADIKRFDFSQVINAYLAWKQGQIVDANVEKTKVETEGQELQNMKTAEDLKGSELDNELKKYNNVRAGLMVAMERANLDAKKIENDLIRLQTDRERIAYLQDQKILEKMGFEVKSEEQKAKYLEALAIITTNSANSFENTVAGRNVKYGFDRVKDLSEAGGNIIRSAVPEVNFGVFKYDKHGGTYKTVRKRGFKK